MEREKSADEDILLNPGFSSVWIVLNYATALHKCIRRFSEIVCTILLDN
jgi:hypothetical protein